MTITYYGHPERLARVPDSLTATVVFSGLVAPCVQSFFAYRIYRLSNSWYIPCFCWGFHSSAWWAPLSLFRRPQNDNLRGLRSTVGLAHNHRVGCWRGRRSGRCWNLGLSLLFRKKK
ncbi:hypothetical protein B0H17DRAFT_462778 [Mycena rosella]|uniref:Uncharacterized protein n=1 Tax=Mycena rosella TaxID=1033263 RepID=A0AAD7C9T3_MYCRO|nr:hypothetical protein B0H17DRAFT_462778 [Mycena rosella]